MGALILVAIILALVVPSSKSTGCTSDSDCLPAETCMNGKCVSPPQPVPQPVPTVPAPQPVPTAPVPQPIPSVPFPQPTQQSIVSSYDCSTTYSSRRPGDPYTIRSSDTDSTQTDACVRSVVRHEIPPAPIGSNNAIQSASATERDLIDVINYSDSIVYLYKSGRMRTHLRSLTTRLRFTSLALFEGYLMALSRGTIYLLITNTYDLDEWEFEPFYPDATIKGAIRISSPLDGSVLAVQTEDRLYMISGGSITSISFPDTMRRVYGSTKEMYIDIDMLNRRGKDWKGREYANIIDAVINYEGVVTTLTVQSALANGYSGLRIVNWVPFYLLS